MASAVCELRRLLLASSMPWRLRAADVCRLVSGHVVPRGAGVDCCDLARLDVAGVADFLPTIVTS